MQAMGKKREENGRDAEVGSRIFGSSSKDS
jgi:hypothetical protein